MQYTEDDLQILNKIIYQLATNNGLSTVPEILYGYTYMPNQGSEEDMDCRAFEDILIENGLCSVQSGWMPNDTPGGYKLLELDKNGRHIIRFKKSVQEFFADKNKR